jgi:hypothetical protein
MLTIFDFDPGAIPLSLSQYYDAWWQMRWQKAFSTRGANIVHKKADAERVIRHLALEWMHETNYQQQPV